MRAPDRVERLRRPDGCAVEARLFNCSASRAIALSNGLGCPDLLFRHLVDDLGTDHRLVTWDYRGQGGSEMPRGAGALGLSAHGGDLGAVQAAAGAPSAIHVGFGFGVSVVLEHCRRAPGAVEAMVLLQGGPRRRGGSPLPSPAEAFGAAMTGAAALAPLGAGLAHRLGLARVAADGAVAMGLVGPSCDRADLRAYVDGLAELRPEDHLDVVGALRGGRAPGAYLEGIDVPTLVFGATRDPLYPESTMRELHERIRSSEYERLGGASRACLLELGPVIAARIRRFLRERLR